ncbi:MAG: hypothetical protein ACTSUF_12730 [Candidatus Heimdallarchaeaceae archaeon]
MTETLVADNNTHILNNVILIYLVVFLIFLVVIWLFQRARLKNALEHQKETFYSIITLSNILPTISVAFLLLTVIQSSPLKQNPLAVTFTLSFFETIQIFIITALLVSLFYDSIEQTLGTLIFKTPRLPSRTNLNMRLAEKQFRFSTQKIWHLILLFFGSALFIANILVFFAYPPIPTEFDDPTIALYYPNIYYKYDSTLGARQELFSAYFIPPKALINWKLVQSVLSIGYLIIFIIFFKQKVVKHEDSSNDDELVYANIENLADSEQPVLDLSILLLSSYQPTNLYVPPTSIYLDSPSKMEKFANNIKNSALIPMLKLAFINFGISYVIILIAQMMGVLDVTDLTKFFYLQLTRLYWAGYSEELTFRLLLFGIPLFLVQGTAFVIKKYLIRSGRNDDYNKSKRFKIIHSSIFPSKYLVGGWKQFSFVDLFFLIFSSAMFGYAHFQFGWPLWKIVQTGVVGVIIGYAYCKYGLHAAIFLHVTMDFSAGLLLPLNLGWMSIGFMIVIFFMVFGGLYVFYFASKGIKWSFVFLCKILGRGVNEL